MRNGMLNSNNYRFLSLLWFYILFPEILLVRRLDCQITTGNGSIGEIVVAGAPAEVGIAIELVTREVGL